MDIVGDVHAQKVEPTPSYIGGYMQGGSMLVAVVVAVVATSLLLIAFIACLVRRYSCRKKSVGEVNFEELGGYKTRSAPSSRHPSPGVTKKPLSRTASQTSDKAILIRTMTTDMIPEFILPPELVQPAAGGVRRNNDISAQGTALGKVQPDLYTSPSETEETEPPPSPDGRIWFSLIYDAAVEQLTVHLNKAKYLKGRDKTNAPRDPFVKVYLLPDERTCQESRVRKKTLAPKFNDTFTFQLPASEVTKRTLRLSMYDVDKRRVRHSLGHVLLSLGDVDLTKDDLIWQDMEPVSQGSTSLGEINFSLTYLPETDKLKVVILRARNLRKLDYDADQGIYIKVQLLRGGRVQRCKKTSGQRGTCEPVYNESFTFTVTASQLDVITIIVTVMMTSSSRIGAHDVEYGRVVVGPPSSALAEVEADEDNDLDSEPAVFNNGNEDLIHWQEMLTQPRQTVTRWHALTNKPPAA